ncbi:tyrosine-type recombinase/integrase [Chakrabartyella piscis]|uniref:tyrosine-type recombinase/integrase n=1 Tax=Chakrabartyella piscis TaxID=2918914 RepID=UPI00295875FD|nr:tyrosine-type recombinase/integrase [Chakrabartyella piscis]
MAKRGQGEGSISKRPNGTWYARITLGRDENGKQKRKSFYGKTRKEVQEQMTEALNDVNKGAYIEPSNVTLNEWLDFWLEEYKRPNVQPKTYLGAASEARLHIRPQLGECKLQDLRPEQLQKFINGFVGEGYKESSIDRLRVLLKSALQQAADNDLIRKNPMTTVKTPKSTKISKKRTLTLDEQKKFIEAAQYHKSGDICILILLTGLRVGEAKALTWSDIDFEGKLLTVTKNVQYVKNLETGKYEHVIYPPKTEAGTRIVPLIPQAVQLLLEKLENQRKFFKFLNIPHDESTLIFPSPYTGTYYLSPSINNAVQAICKTIGVSDISTHCLRHTFATQCYESGIDLKIIQEILGHSSINMTADIYTHVSQSIISTAIQKLSNAIDE